MRLTQWTDYSLRVLMYCAASTGREQPPTIGEIAVSHGISRSHLTKIVMTLSALGWLETSRGRKGGLRLLKPACEIMLGEVIRRTETDFHLVECFDKEHNKCRLNGYCSLKGVLKKAMDNYFLALDGVSLADLVQPIPHTDRKQSMSLRALVPGLPTADH